MNNNNPKNPQGGQRNDNDRDDERQGTQKPRPDQGGQQKPGVDPDRQKPGQGGQGAVKR